MASFPWFAQAKPLPAQGRRGKLVLDGMMRGGSPCQDMMVGSLIIWWKGSVRSEGAATKTGYEPTAGINARGCLVFVWWVLLARTRLPLVRLSSLI